MTKIKSALAYAEQIGERLKQARLNQNLTQAELAQFVGVSRKTIILQKRSCPARNVYCHHDGTQPN